MSVTLTLLIAVAVLVGSEFALRRFWPLPDPYADDKLVIRPSAAYVPRGYAPHYVADIRVAGVPELPESGRLTANSLGMRTPEFSRTKPTGVTRIVLLGGSAMECWHLDEDLTVRSLVERGVTDRAESKAEVIFAGAWAARSYDHIASLGHRVFHLQPDLVVLAGGLGDAFEALDGRDYLLPPTGPGPAKRSTRRLLAYLATQLQIGRHAHRLLKPTGSGDNVLRLNSLQLTDWYQASAPPGAKERGSLATRSDAYRENLVTAVGMAVAHRTPIVLCTQPTRFMTPRPEVGDDPWVPVGTGAFRRSHIAEVTAHFNNVTREVAAAMDVALCDLAAMFDGHAECFYDDFHYGSLGATLTANALAEFIASAAVGPQPLSPAAVYSPRQR